MYRPLFVFSSVAVFCSTLAIGAVASEEPEPFYLTPQVTRRMLGGSADSIGSDTQALLYGAAAVLTCNPRDVGGDTYFGFVVGTGFVFAEHHRLTLETGVFFNGQDVKGTPWNEGNIRYRYQQSTTILPFVFSYNYCTYFKDAGIGLRVGPLAGMFLSVDSSGLYSYDPDEPQYNDDDEYAPVSWSRVHGHDKTDVFFGGGGELGLVWQLGKSAAVDLSYRFFYTSSHRIFNTQSGPASNHQVTLSVSVRF